MFVEELGKPGKYFSGFLKKRREGVNLLRHPLGPPAALRKGPPPLTKSRVVDLTKGDSFGFLGFEFRRMQSRRGLWRADYAPRTKKRTALLQKLKDVFRSFQSRPIREVIGEVNPIIAGWVNYFRIGHSSRCFHVVRRCIEKKVRRHMARVRGRVGFGWKRWSTEFLYRTLGLYDDYQIRYYELPKALPGR